MSLFDDYRYDVTDTEFVDQDVERLISGESPRDPELASLTHWIEALRSYRTVVPSIGAPEQLVVTAAAAVRSGQKAHLDLVPVRTDVRPDRRPSWLATRAAAALATFILLIGVSAVAFAAHVSIPGDALYGLDRALEALGIGDGSITERLVEADTLVAGGDDLGAFALLGEIIERETDIGNDAAASIVQRHLEDVTMATSSDSVAALEKVERLRVFIEENKGVGVGLDGDDFSEGLTSIVRDGS